MSDSRTSCSSHGRERPGCSSSSIPNAQSKSIIQVLQTGHLHRTQNFVHRVRDLWRSQSENALWYQQEQFENVAQEHGQVAYAQVEFSAALASNRAEAQMTSRFWHIEKDVEATFSRQKRWLFFDIDFLVSSGTRSSATLSVFPRSYSSNDAETHS